MQAYTGPYTHTHTYKHIKYYDTWSMCNAVSAYIIIPQQQLQKKKKKEKTITIFRHIHYENQKYLKYMQLYDTITRAVYFRWE